MIPNFREIPEYWCTRRGFVWKKLSFLWKPWALSKCTPAPLLLAPVPFLAQLFMNPQGLSPDICVNGLTQSAANPNAYSSLHKSHCSFHHHLLESFDAQPRYHLFFAAFVVVPGDGSPSLLKLLCIYLGSSMWGWNRPSWSLMHVGSHQWNVSFLTTWSRVLLI